MSKFPDRSTSYQIGLKLGKSLFKRFEISSGINFQKVVNKIEWRQTTVVNYEVVWDDEAFFYIDDQGQRTSNGGNVLQTEIHSRYVKGKQVHNLINVPIQLGWTKLFAKYNLGVHFGPSINISHVFQGRIVGENSDIIIHTTDSYQDVYRSQLGLSWLGDIQVGRNISQSAELFTTISYQYNRESMMQDKNILTSRNQNLIINLGMRKAFY